VAEVGPDGPSSIAVPTIAEVSSDPAIVAAGLEVFTAKGCGACHKFGAKLVGPDLKGVFTRRSIPWVERMITDPGVMVKQDPQAKQLFRELMVEMPKQGVSNEELPKLLAYLKSEGG
jgi:mono/diheme cytochrome c family protein